ncbi:ATP-binding protein [uncultured Jannaschia sp.]|uniref:ATP-binding protein n=1 Tax=uncultured Jannaschia sp. TaxID=293347 RepID=UPI002638F0C2|nr:ATP-binding protein [uncultured Jannaschia sp.]
MSRAAAEPAADELIRARFPATDLAVREQIARVRVCLCRTRASVALQENVAILLGEILNNIVEHSLAGRHDARIALAVSRDADGICVETQDVGEPLPPQLLTSARLPETAVDVVNMPEGGFGWFIIHALADEMVYVRDEGTNRLSFRLSEPAP